MKTIEIISGEQRAIFTTRSVTFDGKEFLYINMTDVSNDPDACVYTFTYDNEIKLLPYEAKDAAVSQRHIRPGNGHGREKGHRKS